MDLGWLSAKYCVRQDARSFLEAWGFAVALAGAALTVARAGGRRAAALLAFFALATCGLAVWAFRWCSLSAAVQQGLGAPDARHDYSALGCLTLNTAGFTQQWILGVVALLGALWLLTSGIRSGTMARRTLSSFAAAALLFFVAADGFFLIFGYSWCGSHRMF